MQPVIYSNNGGLGLILNAEEKILDFCEPTSITINKELLEFGDKTTLSGYFTKPLIYCGLRNGIELLKFK